MCLYTKTKKPKIARKDIICYKILDRAGCNKYETPYIGFHIPRIPYIIDDSKKTVNIKDSIDCHGNLEYIVREGYIHAYKCIQDVCPTYRNQVIVKCIIPKNTKYFDGLNGDICARRMHLLKTVSREEELIQSKYSFWDKLKHIFDKFI